MYDYCATCRHRHPQVMSIYHVDPDKYWCLMYAQQPEMCKAGRSCGLWRRVADPGWRRPSRTLDGDNPEDYCEIVRMSKGV